MFRFRGILEVMIFPRRLQANLMLASVVALVVFPSIAWAHASYESSNPADGATVGTPPSEVWAEYSEPPTQESWLQIYDPCGVRVDSGTYSYFGKRITTQMSGDKAGEYTVLWRVVSDLDSHPTSGEFTFTVTDGAPCPSQEEDPDTGGDGGGKNRGGGSRSGQAGAEPVETTQEDETPVVESGEEVVKEKKSKKHDRPKKQMKERAKANRADRPIDLVASEPETEGDTSGDLPTGWLLIAFGIAALIGAAGGQIYANIIDD